MKLLRRLAWIVGLTTLAVAMFIGWVIWPVASGPPAAPPPEPAPWDQGASDPQYLPSIDPPALAGGSSKEACDSASAPSGAAAVNGASLATLTWAPFGRPETGWEIYAPRVAVEIGTTCDPASAGFAAALARWQKGHGLAPSGVFDPASFGPMLVA